MDMQHCTVFFWVKHAQAVHISVTCLKTQATETYQREPEKIYHRTKNLRGCVRTTRRSSAKRRRYQDRRMNTCHRFHPIEFSIILCNERRNDSQVTRQVGTSPYMIHRTKMLGDEFRTDCIPLEAPTSYNPSNTKWVTKPSTGYFFSMVFPWTVHSEPTETIWRYTGYRFWNASEHIRRKYKYKEIAVRYHQCMSWTQGNIKIYDQSSSRGDRSWKSSDIQQMYAKNLLKMKKSKTLMRSRKIKSIKIKNSWSTTTNPLMDSSVDHRKVFSDLNEGDFLVPLNFFW